LLNAMIPVQSFNIEKLAEAAAVDTSAVVAFMTDNGMEEAAAAASEGISAFEKWCDNFEMDYIRIAQYSSFGFEPLLGFLYGKKVEIQAVRIVLYGMMSRVDKDIIRERLRELYV
jgi:V/A-type H+-transporting ATPase subunit C